MDCIKDVYKSPERFLFLKNLQTIQRRNTHGWYNADDLVLLELPTPGNSEEDNLSEYSILE